MRLVRVGIALAISVCITKAASYVPADITPPAPPREFRAAWVATVGNIDWPSTNNLSTAQQKAELTAIMDKASQLRLNAVIFQVRAACDAAYASKIEPWSEYLTGSCGRAPNPYYDPLTLAIDLAHKRGLELHAWFNPYRARHSSAKSPAPANHISRAHPELVRQYGRQLWLDPGEKKVQDYSLGVVMDVVRRYDIDGVHFDDYFYPYKEKEGSGAELDFPDEQSWRRYGAGGKLERDDWRRENVNTFIQRVYKSVKAVKPWVKFGVSPFGIWRPENPPQIRGYDAYEKLYADSRKWLANGWLDYLAPQLYWSIDAPAQSYPVLLKWWAGQNTMERHLWPGMNTYNVGRTWKPDEILRQIQITRKQAGATGHIHWDMRKGLMAGNGLGQALLQNTYTQPALVPASKWLGDEMAGKPMLTATGRGKTLRVSWKANPGEKPRLWLLQTRRGNAWTTEILAAGKTVQVWKASAPEAVSVCSVDRYGNCSPPKVLQRAN